MNIKNAREMNMKLDGIKQIDIDKFIKNIILTIEEDLNEIYDRELNFHRKNFYFYADFKIFKYIEKYLTGIGKELELLGYSVKIHIKDINEGIEKEIEITIKW